MSKEFFEMIFLRYLESIEKLPTLFFWQRQQKKLLKRSSDEKCELVSNIAAVTLLKHAYYFFIYKQLQIHARNEHYKASSVIVLLMTIVIKVLGSFLSGISFFLFLLLWIKTIWNNLNLLLLRNMWQWFGP